MECNKDEAIRAKAIAESKLKQNDFVGAKKFVLKAQNLYPGLDDIPQMLIVLNIHLAAMNKIGGEADWYQVLDVSPSANDDAIKKQYKKLALILHPDKNSSIGAIGAFQLISAAHRLLMDKQQREAYNKKRTECMRLQQKVPTHNGGPSAPCWPNQHNTPPYSCGQSVPPGPSEEKVPSAPTQRSRKKGPAHAGGSSAPPQRRKYTASAQNGGPSMPTHPSGSWNRRSKVPMTPNPATFWTICCFCRIQFEYYKKYQGLSLLCQECHSPFLAKDLGLPKFSGSGPVPWQRKSQSANFPSQNACDPKGNVAAAQKPGATSSNASMNTNCQQGPPPGSVNPDNRFPSTAEKPGNAVPLERVNLKRSRTESRGSVRTESAFGTGTYGFSSTHNQPSSTRKMTSPETRKMLLRKAQEDIPKKL